MIQVDLMRLMTWKRRCPSLFPHGSSIVPLICSVIIVQIPTVALVCRLISLSMLTSWLPALILLFDLLSLVLLLICVYTDPGVIPQIVNHYEWNSELLHLPSVNHQIRQEHSYLNVGFLGLSTLEKYCVECHIYRPTRTIHCKECNHCVEIYDHHCPWLGVCIGKHNYKYFVSFLAAVTVHTALMFGCCLAVAILSIQQSRTFPSFLMEAIIGIISFVIGITLSKLLMYHIGLINRGLTTNEDLKNTYQIIWGKVPFTRGVGHPSLLQLGGKLVKGDELMMSLEERNSKGVQGRRYSTLVTERQSVLNALVQNDLL